MEVYVTEGRMRRSTSKSAGYDLFATEDVYIPSQSYAIVPTGVKTRMVNCYGMILDRSGLAAKHGVSRRAGLIDEDYAGEWMVVLHNESEMSYTVRHGERIAQVVFVPKFDGSVFGAEELDVTRDGGLGSTGQ